MWKRLRRDFTTTSPPLLRSGIPSPFFRPGQDYDSTLSGSAFHAFAERSDSGDTLWRFGWDAATDSLAFTVRSGTTDYTVPAAYSLHKGTGYHLAATLSGGYQRIFVDGVQVAVISGTPSVKTGTQILYVGHDFPSNTYLKGTLDEVAVYSVSKTAAALKAMATFVQGSNALIVPRGLWYESKLNQTLDGSDPRSSNPVLNKITVQANQFAVSGTLTLDAYLNARPVQMVLSGNVTLEEAQWFVDQLRLNRTGKTTAFLLDVTDEFYTVGFVGAVIALAPNATVDNSVNHTASAPPTPWWAQLFNAIVSVAAIAWNAALAVAQFMINLVKWLVNIVVGLVIGLATGDWTYFVDNVVKPFVEAMMALVKFIIDLVSNIVRLVVDAALGPLVRAVDRAFSTLTKGLVDLAIALRSGRDTTVAEHQVAGVLIGADMQALRLALFVVAAILVIVGTLTLPFSWGVGVLAGILIGMVVSAVFSIDLSHEKRPAGEREATPWTAKVQASTMIRTGNIDMDPLPEEFVWGAVILDALGLLLDAVLIDFAGLARIPRLLAIASLAIAMVMGFVSVGLSIYLAFQPDDVRNAAGNALALGQLGVAFIGLVLAIGVTAVAGFSPELKWLELSALVINGVGLLIAALSLEI